MGVWEKQKAVGEMGEKVGSNCSINTIGSGRTSSIGKISVKVLVIFTQPAASAKISVRKGQREKMYQSQKPFSINWSSSRSSSSSSSRLQTRVHFSHSSLDPNPIHQQHALALLTISPLPQSEMDGNGKCILILLRMYFNFVENVFLLFFNCISHRFAIIFLHNSFSRRLYHSGVELPIISS